jgi:hypothetical protein
MDPKRCRGSSPNRYYPFLPGTESFLFSVFSVFFLPESARDEAVWRRRRRR